MFYGIDQDGACIYTSNQYNFSNPTIADNPNISINYDYNFNLHNDLTFEDKIQFGCFELLNVTELQTYCTTNQWQKKHILTSINNFSYFSQFGNPNNSYISDWIQLQQIDFKSYSSSWDSNYYKCSVPAFFSIDIILADFGMVNNSQSSIIYVSQRLNYMYNSFKISDWFANVPGYASKIKYNTYVEVNFWKMNQTTVLWIAPQPPMFPKLPKNLMAPFKIGTTTYGKSNYLCFSYLVFIFYILLSF